MIRVKPQPKPENFFDTVIKKAEYFFRNNPNPSPGEIRENPHWRGALDDLYSAYGKICSYSALWISRDAATVDHFIPIAALKGKKKKLAYSWNNFRLASRSMNTEKHNFQDVVDPFHVETGWFVMDFPSLMIRSGDGLSQSAKENVEATINRLKLNVETEYIEYRAEFLLDYCKRCRKYMDIYPDFNIGPEFESLEEDAPFIAYELKRQGLEKQIIYMMEYLASPGKKDHYA
jgi:hypothetical protein